MEPLDEPVRSTPPPSPSELVLVGLSMPWRRASADERLSVL